MSFDGQSPESGDTVWLRASDRGGWWSVPAFACTVIVTPIKVGDVVTADNIGQMPGGTIVARAKETPYWRSPDSDVWFSWTNTAPQQPSVVIGTTVLRIGGGS